MEYDDVSSGSEQYSTVSEHVVVQQPPSPPPIKSRVDDNGRSKRQQSPGSAIKAYKKQLIEREHSNSPVPHRHRSSQHDDRTTRDYTQREYMVAKEERYAEKYAEKYDKYYRDEREREKYDTKYAAYSGNRDIREVRDERAFEKGEKYYKEHERYYKEEQPKYEYRDERYPDKYYAKSMEAGRYYANSSKHEYSKEYSTKKSSKHVKRNSSPVPEPKYRTSEPPKAYAEQPKAYLSGRRRSPEQSPSPKRARHRSRTPSPYGMSSKRDRTPQSPYSR